MPVGLLPDVTAQGRNRGVLGDNTAWAPIDRVRPMRVHVKCFAALIKDNECHYNDARPFQMKTGDTVSDLIRCLYLPTEQIKLIFINGRHGDPDTVLQEGDRVAFAPATFGM